MVKDIEEWRMTTIHKFSFVLPSFGESLSNLSFNSWNSSERTWSVLSFHFFFYLGYGHTLKIIKKKKKTRRRRGEKVSSTLEWNPWPSARDNYILLVKHNQLISISKTLTESQNYVTLVTVRRRRKYNEWSSWRQLLIQNSTHQTINLQSCTCSHSGQNG